MSNEKTITFQQETRLKKARSKVSKVLDIASSHTGTVAHEIRLLAAQALVEIDAVFPQAGRTGNSEEAMIEKRACMGGETKSVRIGTEHGQQCKICGTKVRDDMVNHGFFGFAAGCDKADKPQQQTGEVSPS